MTWIKLDDQFFDHPVTLRAGEKAALLHLQGLAYCSRHLTDGKIPREALPGLTKAARPRELARVLVDVGLWVERKNLYEIRNYLVDQRGAKEVVTERKKGRERVRKFRTRTEESPVGNGASNADVTALHERYSAVSNADVTGARGRGRGRGRSKSFKTSLSEVETNTPRPNPAPTEEGQAQQGSGEKPSPSVVAGSSPEAERLCLLLADRVEANGAKRPAITKAWLDSARLLLERDGRSLEEAERLVRWCQADDFWRGNVLSLPKFREKYDQLRLKELGPRSKVPDPNQDWSLAERGLT